MFELTLGIAGLVIFWKSLRKLGHVSDSAMSTGLDIVQEELKLVELEYSIASQERLAKIEEKINKRNKLLNADTLKAKLNKKTKGE